MNQKAVVLGVIGDDTHSVAYKILIKALRESSFKPIPIGILASQEEFIKAAVETRAVAIFVSTVSGHGQIYCAGLREKAREAGLEDILLYVGGNLVVGKQKWAEVEKMFKEMGYDRVYPPGTKPWVGIEDLIKDLSLKENKGD